MADNRVEYAAPWLGWKDDLPAHIQSPKSFRQITNWLLNKGRIFSAPKTVNFAGPPNGEAALGMRTFMDVVGKFHTAFLTSSQAYFRSAAGVYTAIGAAISPASNLPYAMEIFQNSLVFANGGQTVSFLDGSSALQVCGNCPGTCYFLGKLASHLLMVNTIEPNTGVAAEPWPARIRWSASGSMIEWDTVANPTAGVADIPEVEDQLTGFASLGSIGFAFRNNGITSISPTGVAGAPFDIENFSIGPAGIGCSIPYTLAVYGSTCAFVALDDIYTLDSSGTFNRIGSSAKKSIFADLAALTGAPTATMLGILGVGVDYYTYWLFIPQANSTTVVWIYHFDDQTWVRETLPFGDLTSIANLALT